MEVFLFGQTETCVSGFSSASSQTLNYKCILGLWSKFNKFQINFLRVFFLPVLTKIVEYNKIPPTNPRIVSHEMWNTLP